MTALTALSELRQRIEDEYCRRTPTSRAIHEEARAYLPDGDTRYGTTFLPYPMYIDRGQGSYLYDVDGNVLLDFTNNATSLIHGHAHPAIVEAIQQQAARGTAWAAPNPDQVRLAQILCERVPSLERIRFCNSGTEANMQAIKAARAFTGRDKIVKMDGAYHGTYEGTEFNTAGLATAEGSTNGQPAPVMRGIPLNAAENVLIAPFNDRDTAQRLIAQHQDNLAAVIVTPVMTRGGLITPAPGYLEFLREATRACGALLIFDEVITFRVASGGGQEYYGVTPDLTALGKIIGGGLPVGAFGGRQDIMNLFVNGNPPSIGHAGTFNGNPMTVVAGVTAMERLTPAAYVRLARLGQMLRDRFVDLLGDLGIGLEVNWISSLVSLDLPEQIRSDRTAATAIFEILRLVQLALLNRGIKTYSFYAISTVMTEDEIERLAATLREVLTELAPIIKEIVPLLAIPTR